MVKMEPMIETRRWSYCAVVVVATCGCASDPGPRDGGPRDGGPEDGGTQSADAGGTDAQVRDAAPALDDGGSDAAVARDGSVREDGGGGGPEPLPGRWPEGCDRDPLPGNTWQTPRAIDEFSDVFGTWPGRNGNSERLDINTNQWVSLWFRASSDPLRTGVFETNEAPVPGFRADRGRVLSISECPGDFSPDPPGQACTVGMRGPAVKLWWESGVGLGTGTDWRCTLEAGRVYFLNIIFGDDDDPGTTSCIDPETREPFADCAFLGAPTVDPVPD